jgi:hypothetical protein
LSKPCSNPSPSFFLIFTSVIEACPDGRYLLRQDSKNEQYFDYYGDQERLLEAKQNVRVFAKQAAAVAIKSVPTAMKKLKSKKMQFLETPRSTCTATTSSPSSTALQGMTTYSEIAEVCFKEVGANGSILKGGLGVAIYLRIKLSEIEGARAKDHLQIALGYAMDAVRGSTSDISGSSCFSIMSSDVIGSRCLLVSVLNRLGKQNEARNEANIFLEQAADVLESDSKHDCSVIYGLSGLLQAIWFLRKELSDITFGSECALLVSASILLEGLEYSEKYQTKSLLMWEFRGKPFLGAGTGVVGSK